MIQILYFARLRERLGRERESVQLPAPQYSVADLTLLLRERGGAWQEELASGKAVRVAVNQKMATPQTLIQAGDEVAFFPPVTGG